MKIRWVLIGIFPLLLASIAVADISRCKEKKGYIEQKSLLTVVDLDCSSYKGDELCSILVSTPKQVDIRKFILFTFLWQDNGDVKAYLNLKPTYTTNDVRVGFDFSKNDRDKITISSVYENIEGCTLRSTINLGDI